MSSVWTQSRFRAEIPLIHRLRMLNVELLQRALVYFRKPAIRPPPPMRLEELDHRIGGSRSKRARIKDVLRRYEQAAITQGEAVEEILKITR